MHLVFKVLGIFSVTQAVIAELSSSHNGMENNHRQKRDMYSSNYQATSPSSNYTYSGTTTPASYPSYTSGTSNYPSSGGYNYNQNQQTCDCTMNCYFDTKPCTDVDHPTGCIVQDCTETDTRLIGYTCFCTSTWFPGGCVYPFDGTPRCTTHLPLNVPVMVSVKALMIVAWTIVKLVNNQPAQQDAFAILMILPDNLVAVLQFCLVVSKLHRVRTQLRPNFKHLFPTSKKEILSILFNLRPPLEVRAIKQN
ncbi:hypothetical protein Ocin01_12888 [Orchesella cincta]|uniref:EGF-like domain-containing protein n=1 Tax=Orchesella cincta TaxID=48709 RepID=A0A1D2ML85_ORCCI|nr:hypothetical protein Ocin01_12888 [Orchesella cincta]